MHRLILFFDCGNRAYTLPMDFLTPAVRQEIFFQNKNRSRFRERMDFMVFRADRPVQYRSPAGHRPEQPLRRPQVGFPVQAVPLPPVAVHPQTLPALRPEAADCHSVFQRVSPLASPLADLTSHPVDSHRDLQPDDSPAFP